MLIQEACTSIQDHGDVWPGKLLGSVALLWLAYELTSVASVAIKGCAKAQSGPIPEAMLVLEGQIAAWAI